MSIPNISNTDSGPMAAWGQSYGGATGDFSVGGGGKFLGAPLILWAIGGALAFALIWKRR